MLDIIKTLPACFPGVFSLSEKQTNDSNVHPIAATPECFRTDAAIDLQRRIRAFEAELRQQPGFLFEAAMLDNAASFDLKSIVMVDRTGRAAVLPHCRCKY